MKRIFAAFLGVCAVVILSSYTKPSLRDKSDLIAKDLDAKLKGIAEAIESDAKATEETNLRLASIESIATTNAERMNQIFEAKKND